MWQPCHTSASGVLRYPEEAGTSQQGGLMATTDTEATAQLDLFDYLQTCAVDACSELTSYCHTDGSHSVELSEKFLRAVADVERVTIESLAESVGAFSVEGGTLRIAEGPVAKLLAAVVSKYEQSLLDNASSVEADELPVLLERVFIEYVFHEVRHRTQGLGLHGDVQALKSIAGKAAMTEYDVLADRDAALASAAIYADDESRAAFLKAFREALFFSTSYFFDVFPIPAERPDKIARAMAVLFMAARVAQRDFSTEVIEDQSLPLDATLYVSLSAPTRSLAIHRGEPSRQLLGIANDQDGVADLMDQICSGNMEAALETSISIASKLKLC